MCDIARMPITVDSLRIHPLKSGAIRPLPRLDITQGGPRGDRRWMVVDAEGEAVTARTDRALFRLTAEPLADDGLRLSDRDGHLVEVPRPSGDGLAVTVHGNRAGAGIPVDSPAQELVSRVLGRSDVTLVWCSDPTQRTLDPAFAPPTDFTAYADSYPVTIGSLASLRELHRLGALDVSIDRFRPNIVIDGDLEPFDEDTWAGLQIGDVRFRVAKGVSRCAMTLIEPTTLESGPEPIRTLAKHRQRGGKTWFCLHLLPDTTGTIAVGDEVTPL